MTNSKSTKRALVSSTLAILMCMAMLIGTTFAWFTDTASTAVNKIQSGKLDVALEMYDTVQNKWVSAENETLNFKTADNRTENILWEPGCTYELPQLRVINNGNLALKYKVVITGINGDAELNEVIDWTIGDVALGTEQHLIPGASNEFTIQGHMQEDAGNHYQNMTIDGIGITVVATQDTVEYDSEKNTYDENAIYPIVDTAELIDAIQSGGTVLFGKDVQTPDYFTMSADTTLSLAEKTWTVGDNTKLVGGANFSVSGGKVLNTTYAGYVDVRPGTTTNGVVTYTDVEFSGSYNSGRVTGGSSTTHTDYVVKYTPNAGGHTKFVFKNCTFTNSAVQFSGLSGGEGTFEAVFENCTFNALTNSALIEVKNYLTNSTITVKDCTFNVTATSNFSIIDGNYGRAATVNFEGNNTFTGTIATPTGADKAGTPEEIKIFKDKLNVEACSAKTVNGLDTIVVSGVVTK